VHATMEQTTILTLKPNVTREEALVKFSAGASARLWNLRNGALQRIADAYVPFWGYRIQYDMAGALQSRFLALDAVTGELDLFTFPGMPQGDQLLPVQTRNYLASALRPERAEELLREKALRLVFQQGFFKLRGKIDVIREGAEFHVPYWLGFYGNAKSVRCRVLDAVRRRIEGAKATAFFEEWLAA
jgi:hypothetical protein